MLRIKRHHFSIALQPVSDDIPRIGIVVRRIIENLLRTDNFQYLFLKLF